MGTLNFWNIVYGECESLKNAWYIWGLVVQGILLRLMPSWIEKRKDLDCLSGVPYRVQLFQLA